MTLWVIFAVMVAAVVAALALPLFRRQPPPASRGAHDLAVYRDQLAELEREGERGLLSDEQRVAARLEIERRILAAGADAEAPPAPRGRPWAIAVVIGVLVAAGGTGSYAVLGSPWLPDHPWAEHRNDPDVKINALVDSLSARLKEHPDAKGYAMLGVSQATLGRFDEAVAAWRKAIALGDNNGDAWSSLGEALVLANQGGVVPEARKAFLTALSLVPGDFRARFYIGLGEAQIGNLNKALAIWRDLEKDAPADASWRPMLEAHIDAYAKRAGLDPSSIAPDRSDLDRQVRALSGK